MSDFQLASGRAKRPTTPATSNDTAGFVLPDGTRFTVGNTVTLSAAEIATPTAAILADTTATYIGPAPDYFRYYSNTIALNQIGGVATMAFVTKSVDIIRPADVNAYIANDAWSDSTSAPTVGGFTFSGAVNATGKSGIILDTMIISSNPVGGLNGEIWIFDSAITAINDNTVFAINDTEVKTLIGIIPFTTFTDTNNSVSNQQNLNLGFTSVGSANLRFLVKLLSAYTPASGEVLTVKAKFLQVD